MEAIRGGEKKLTSKKAVRHVGGIKSDYVIIPRNKTDGKDDRRGISKLGTWNVRSMNGKEIELINEFEKAGLEILVVSETKKKGKGEMELENEHLLIWSGIEEKERAQAGIGCILNRDIKEKLNGWEAISERILTVELKYRAGVGTIIAVYGPSEDEKGGNKDRFWEDLGLAVETARGSIIVAGDMNGRVGKAERIYSVIGRIWRGGEE